MRILADDRESVKAEFEISSQGDVIEVKENFEQFLGAVRDRYWGRAEPLQSAIENQLKIYDPVDKATIVVELWDATEGIAVFGLTSESKSIGAVNDWLIINEALSDLTNDPAIDAEEDRRLKI